MNVCHFLGNLTRDPELKTTQSGKSVVKITIAVNRRYKKNDQIEQEVAFINGEAWDTGAEVIAKHFTKGKPIIVHGSIVQDNWTTEDGQKRSALKLRIDSFEFVPGNPKRDSEPAEGGEADAPKAKATAKKPSGKSDEDDIEF